MIARLWRGQATVDNADRYRRHAIERVFPALARLPGHRGAYLLARNAGDQVEFLALTLWDSIASIKNFSGENPERAVIDPEARAILSAFDDFARHYDVAHDPPARHRMTIE
jgi:heme-degrading monooxygenase HmoA